MRWPQRRDHTGTLEGYFHAEGVGILFGFYIVIYTSQQVIVRVCSTTTYNNIYGVVNIFAIYLIIKTFYISIYDGISSFLVYGRTPIASAHIAPVQRPAI